MPSVRQREIRTVALIPSDSSLALEGYARPLHAALEEYGPCKLLTNASVIEALGKNGGACVFAFGDAGTVHAR